jgi:hypothetical protein
MRNHRIRLWTLILSYCGRRGDHYVMIKKAVQITLYYGDVDTPKWAVSDRLFYTPLRQIHKRCTLGTRLRQVCSMYYTGCWLKSHYDRYVFFYWVVVVHKTVCLFFEKYSNKFVLAGSGFRVKWSYTWLHHMWDHRGIKFQKEEIFDRFEKSCCEEETLEMGKKINTSRLIRNFWLVLFYLPIWFISIFVLTWFIRIGVFWIWLP